MEQKDLVISFAFCMREKKRKSLTNLYYETQTTSFKMFSKVSFGSFATVKSQNFVTWLQ